MSLLSMSIREMRPMIQGSRWNHQLHQEKRERNLMFMAPSMICWSRFDEGNELLQNYKNFIWTVWQSLKMSSVISCEKSISRKTLLPVIYVSSMPSA
jgi:hypothetical protein